MKINYIPTSEKGICGSDFRQPERTTAINPQFILSLSEPIMFTLPFSGAAVEKYSVLKMSNGDTYYIKEKQWEKITIPYNTVCESDVVVGGYDDTNDEY